MGDFAFDEDSRVVAAGPVGASEGALAGASEGASGGVFDGASGGVFAAELTGRWNGTAGAVNGGGMVVTRGPAPALGRALPPPAAVSGFFVRRGTAGPATARASVIRSGRTTAFGDTVLTQDGKDVVRATAAFARLGAAGRGSVADGSAGQDGPVYLDGTPPALPPPEE